MDSRNFKDRDLDIDLESGTDVVISDEEGCEEDGSDSNVRQVKKLLNRVRSGFDGCIKGEGYIVDDPFKNGKEFIDRRFEREEKVGLLEDKSVERTKKKGCRKPPKPPRPPRAASLDAADQKLVHEISELAMLKRARIERMKALKNMKNSKGSSSSSNLCALIITLLFCIIIIWQGVFRGNSSENFQDSPELSVGNRGQLIFVQFDRNSSSGSHHSNSASPVLTLRGSNGILHLVPISQTLG